MRNPSTVHRSFFQMQVKICPTLLTYSSSQGTHKRVLKKYSCYKMSRVLMGFDYSLVVLVPQFEYLSTAIEYSPGNIKCFVSTPIEVLRTLVVYAKCQ